MSEASLTRGQTWLPAADRTRVGGLTRAAVLGAFLLLAWVALSRWPYVVDDAMMSKDGPLYVESLRLGRDYSVPMPGNVGYVVLGKIVRKIGADPIRAFAAVNIGLTLVGAGFVWGLARMRLGAALSTATAFALTCNPMVWWHGTTINSYLVWLAILPAIGFFGARFVRLGRFDDLVAMSLSLGIGTCLRQDLLMFGTPLWLGFMLLGRAGRKGWLVGGAIVAACCVVWFLGTSAILGGPEVYLAKVRAKHEGHMEGFSIQHRGLFEGLLRNGSKYILFLIWAVPVVLPACVLAVVRGLASFRRSWRLALLALLWVGPSWWFSLCVFAGNAGLVFPLLPLVYLGAAWGLDYLLRRDGPAYPVVAMAVIGLVSLAQFTLAPMLPETNQRNVILNVTFLRYSGPGLLGRFDRNLDDYGIDPALGSVLRQLRTPEPVPGRLTAAEREVSR